jgi:hypothetical protein
MPKNSGSACLTPRGRVPLSWPPPLAVLPTDQQVGCRI